MVAHSKGKLKRVWKGLFRGVGGDLQLGMVKHPNLQQRETGTTSKAPWAEVRGTQIMAWQAGGRGVNTMTLPSFVL